MASNLMHIYFKLKKNAHFNKLSAKQKIKAKLCHTIFHLDIVLYFLPQKIFMV